MERVSTGSATIIFATLPLFSAVPDLNYVIFDFHVVTMSVKISYEVH